MSLTTAAITREGDAGVDPTRPAGEAASQGSAGASADTVDTGGARAWSARALDLAEDPPAVAFLSVENRRDGYVISGKCGELGERAGLKDEEIGAQHARLLARELPPEMIHLLLSAFAHSSPLVTWLRGLRKKLGERLVLVIEDRSSSGMPWEMLPLHTTRPKYLGSEITTVRWVHALRDTDDDEEEERDAEDEDDEDDEDKDKEDKRKVKQSFDPDACTGTVLSHVDPDERAALPHAVASLETLGPPAIEDIEAFRQRIKRGEEGCGLVYLLCHGYTGSSPVEIQIGSAQDSEKRLKLEVLRRTKLELLEKSRSVVFVNACNSGVVVQDTTVLHGDFQRGFAELFLGKGARGVIGTLAEVEAKDAVEVAERFLAKVSAPGGTSVAHALRELRAEVARSMTDSSKPADYEKLYSVFLYVYYGNPRTVLYVKRGVDA
jgi:hypothetical protein